MPLTITLELSCEVEAKLRAKIASHDAEGVRQLLANAFAPTVEVLLQRTSDQLNDEEFEAAVDQLTDELVAYVGSNVPVLSDYAVSRAGIYEDHP
jgi:antitoxin ParD1/3/4